MRKIYVKKLVILSILLFLLLLICGCNEEENKPEFDEYDKIYIQYMNDAYGLDNIEFDSLTCYFYNDTYYYDAEYERKESGLDLHVLFIFKYRNIEMSFGIKDEEVALKNYYFYYTNFINSKDEGIIHVLSQDKISKLIEELNEE